jgi:site-specific DNA recombinase
MCPCDTLKAQVPRERGQASNMARVLKAIRESGESDESTSVEGQDNTLDKWIGDNNHTEAGRAEDTDTSARKISPFKRPKLGKWFTEPLANEWDILACSKQDRMFRSVADIGAVTSWCIAHGKSWVAIAENTDLSTPAGRMFANTLAAFGEFEADRGGERRAEAAERFSRRGQWDGGTYLIGYVPVKVGFAWRLAQSDKAPITLDMAMRATAGDSNGKIARWLNDSGILTTRGNQWNAMVVGRLLRNPALAGYAVYKGAILFDEDTGEHIMITDNPILTEDQWLALQAALDSRKQTRGERVGGHMLLRVAYCAKCSTPERRQPIYGHLRQGRKKLDNLYRCQRCGFSITMAKLERQVEFYIMAKYGSRPLPRKVVIPAISHTAQLAKVQRKIAEIDEQYAAGSLPAAAYARMMTRLESDSERLAGMEQRPAQVTYERTGQTVRELWATLDNAGKGAFLRKWGFRLRVAHGAVPELADDSDASIAEAFGLVA